MFIIMEVTSKLLYLPTIIIQVIMQSDLSVCSVSRKRLILLTIEKFKFKQITSPGSVSGFQRVRVGVRLLFVRLGIGVGNSAEPVLPVRRGTHGVTARNK